MSKIIKGSCYNVSIYRTVNDTELLSIMIKDKDSQCWKCNLGEWCKFINNYEEIVNLMMEDVSVELREDAQPADGYHPAKYVPQDISD